MRMAYWMRIAVGALFGVVALLALWPTLGITWVTALVAALAAPIGFLGSYFVISADRPEEGYEQVLFDRPNTIVSAVMIVAFALAGVGTGFIPAGGAPPELTPADRVFALKAEYQSVYDGWTSDASQADTLARIEALREESDRITKFDLAALPNGTQKDTLEAANDAYAFALDALKICAKADTRKCMEARLNAADAELALQKYVAAAEAPAANATDAAGDAAGEAPEA